MLKNEHREMITTSTKSFERAVPPPTLLRAGQSPAQRRGGFVQFLFMLRRVALIFAISSAAVSSAQQQAVPTRRIVPADVVRESIEAVQLSTNAFVVRWAYTEAGAKKMLAFCEANQNKKVRTIVGTYQSPPRENAFHPNPPYYTNYAQWKERWLKSRTDKLMAESEQDAKKIVAGLTGSQGQPPGQVPKQ
jgi:hypothetical protein